MGPLSRPRHHDRDSQQLANGLTCQEIHHRLYAVIPPRYRSPWALWPGGVR